jgi:hypothetical protein
MNDSRKCCTPLHTTGGRAGMSRNSDGRLEVSKRTRAYG